LSEYIAKAEEHENAQDVEIYGDVDAGYGAQFAAASGLYGLHGYRQESFSFWRLMRHEEMISAERL
jgi:hypothetical protein